MQEQFGVSQRRACGWWGSQPSTLRYRSRARDDEPLRLRLG